MYIQANNISIDSEHGACNYICICSQYVFSKQCVISQLFSEMSLDMHVL